MRVALVVNPTASAVAGDTLGGVEQALREAGHDVITRKTTARGHATRLAAEAAGDGAGVVAVLGGDGTLNEAANGLLGASTALAVLPGGSTNVFARTIGVDRRIERATAQLRDALAAGSRRRIGVGMANDRCFLFHVGMGYDAAVVEDVERRAGLKRVLGHALFAYSALTTWICGYDRSRPRFTVHAGGESVEPVESVFTVCLNTNPYTFVGPLPFDVAPGTGLGTALTLVSFRDLGLRTFWSATLSSLAGGQRVDGVAGVERTSNVTTARVEGHGPFPYQVDGDYLGEVGSLDLRHEPDRLELVVPA